MVRVSALLAVLFVAAPSWAQAGRDRGLCGGERAGGDRVAAVRSRRASAVRVLPVHLQGDLFWLDSSLTVEIRGERR